MATATKSTTDILLEKVNGVAGSLTSINERVSKIETAQDGLKSLLKQPASRTGISPEELIARATKGGDVSGTFLPDGTFRPLPWNRGGKRVGTVLDAEGKSYNFGEFLGAFAEYGANGPRSPKAMEVLDKQFGVQGIRVDEKSGMIQKTALAESSGVTGGYTIPPQFVNKIMTYAIEQALVQPRASKQPLTARTVQVPSLDIVTKNGAGNSNLLGGVIANWTAEAATRTETEPQFRMTTLTAWELSFYTVASNTLLMDNAVGLDSFLTQLFAAAIAWYTDFAYFQGNGVGKPMGILNAAANLAVNRKDTGHFRIQDVAAMLGKLYWMLSGDRSGIAWVIHQSVIPDLFSMSDYTGSTAGTGRLVFQPINQGVQEAPGQSAGVQSFGYLGGYPVLITEKVPALGGLGDVNLIHFPSYLLGERMELEIATSPHVKFLNNQMVWRGVFRGDGQPWLQGAITLADGTQTVSPFISLN